MLHFQCDYTKGCHPAVLQRLIDTNMEDLPGYDVNCYTESAKEKIRKACNCPEAQIFFMVGGTQTNQNVISTMLAPYEGVVATNLGHVATHEAGAIEYSGHKVLEVPAHDGKVKAEDVKKLVATFYGDDNHSHMVYPGMVYVSHPTETGTLYTKAELEAIADVCHQYKMHLYLDGARLGYGLASPDSDLTIEDIARITDVFYIGGTKVGALCGEALVFTKNNMPDHFVTMVKQHGALLAKGRLLGVQFDALFTDDLYFKLGQNAMEKAQKMRAIFEEKGYEYHYNSPSNQQFFVLENSKMKELAEHVVFERWEVIDENHTAARFCTSWATTDEDLEALKAFL